MKAIALEFTMVCSVWLLGALACEGVAGMRRRWSRHRARTDNATSPTANAAAKANPKSTNLLMVIEASRVAS